MVKVISFVLLLTPFTILFMMIFDMKLALFSVFSMILLSGCSTTWEPQGASDYTLQEAKLICDFDANTRYPIRKEVLQRTVYRDVQKTCRKDDKDHCGDKKTYTERVPMTESYVEDINQEDRKTFYTSCMSLKGWETKKSLFLGIVES